MTQGRLKRKGAVSAENNASGLAWPPLVRGTLIRRYKRFLADAALPGGETVTAHCPNSGAMKACCEPGRDVYLSRHDRKGRKLKYTWELIRMPASLVGVNTMVPNRLVGRSIKQGLIEDLNGYDRVDSEVKVGDRSRLDFRLRRDGDRDCYVEVKNCTLVADGTASFPDAVTSRGLRHLVEMQSLVQKGFRCVMFYLVQRMDAGSFRPADQIDPEYGRELRRASQKGVEILVYDVDIDFDRIKLRQQLPWSV